MITRTKLSQLEGKFSQISKGRGGHIIRDITEDGRLLDKDDFVMTEQEVKFIEKENKELVERGYTFIYLIDDHKPKLKPGSTTIPHYMHDYGQAHPV